MDQQTIAALVAFILAHKWLAAAAVVIFFVVRLFKADVPLPLVAKIPSKLRTLLAVVLGFVGMGIQAVVTGVPWQQALAENLIGALLAILAHDGVIEYLRGGRELFAKPVAPPKADAPPKEDKKE